jgi:membrane fusion protein, multidrug efflux system
MKKINSKHFSLKLSAIFMALISLVYSTNALAQDDTAAKKMQGPKVTAVTIVKEDIELSKSFSGRTLAANIVDITPQVSGVITQVNFKDGQKVKAGDLLFVIDPRTFKAKVEKLEADLKAALNEEENDKRNFLRAKELRKTSTVSQSNFEERETTYTVAVSNREAIEANLTIAKVDLDHAYVKSPINGKVSRAEITLGNYVSAGGKILTTVVADDKMYVDFEVDESTYLKSIKRSNDSDLTNNLNVPVTVISSGDGKEYLGEVSSFDNQIDISSGTIRARAIFDNKDNSLISGMFVTVEMGTPLIKDQIMVSEKSIGTNQNRKFVYVIGENNMIEYRGVTLGDSLNGKRIVLDGLKVGDVIVSDGLIKLRPGMPVSPELTK